MGKYKALDNILQSHGYVRKQNTKKEKEKKREDTRQANKDQFSQAKKVQEKSKTTSPFDCIIDIGIGGIFQQNS